MSHSSRDDNGDIVVEFNGVTRLYNTLDRVQDDGIDFVKISNVSQESYDRIDKERTERRRRFRFFYQANERQLRVTLPTGPHEGAHAGLFTTICVSMASSPQLPPLFPVGSRTYTTHKSDSIYGKSSNEADSGGYPSGQAAHEDVTKWPSLVIECGFTASEHEVKIVLVVKLDRQAQTMLVEQFVEEPSHVRRPGATTTRSISALKQAITILPTPNSDPTRYSVTRGALVLDFNLLHRRAPGSQLGPNERDVIVSEDDLEQNA